MTSETHDVRLFIRRVYDISYISDLHSAMLSDELPGRSGTTIMDSRLELALLKSAIVRSLGWDYLIDTMDAIFSDDPESIFSLAHHLSKKLNCGMGAASVAIERIKLMSHDGASEVTPNGRAERVLVEWLDFSLDILGKEFTERGWLV